MNMKAIAVALSMVFAAVSGQAFADETAAPATTATDANVTIATEAPAAGQEEVKTEEAAKEEKATEAAE